MTTAPATVVKEAVAPASTVEEAVVSATATTEQAVALAATKEEGCDDDSHDGHFYRQAKQTDTTVPRPARHDT